MGSLFGSTSTMRLTIWGVSRTSRCAHGRGQYQPVTSSWEISWDGHVTCLSHDVWVLPLPKFTISLKIHQSWKRFLTDQRIAAETTWWVVLIVHYCDQRFHKTLQFECLTDLEPRTFPFCVYSLHPFSNIWGWQRKRINSLMSLQSANKTVSRLHNCTTTYSHH